MAVTPPACTESVDATPRRGDAFTWQNTLVHEFDYQQLGAQLVIPRNPRRIRAVLYAPTRNSGTIYIGDASMRRAPGDRLTGPNAVEMEPGTGWEIDDTIAAIYAFCVVGTGDQAVHWYEAQDDSRIPPVVSR